MAFRPQPPLASDSPAERLIHVVAEQTNTDPVALPPLYDTIYPDALDALLASMETGYIEFEYAEQLVRFESDGTIHLPSDGVLPARQAEEETDGGNTAAQ